MILEFIQRLYLYTVTYFFTILDSWSKHKWNEPCKKKNQVIKFLLVILKIDYV